MVKPDIRDIYETPRPHMYHSMFRMGVASRCKESIMI